MLEISWNHAAAHITTTHAYAGVPSQISFAAKAPESHDGWDSWGSPKTGIVPVPAMCPVFKYTQAATDSLALTATTNDLPSLRKLGRMLEAKTKGVGGQFQEGKSWWNMVELKHFLWGLICSLLDLLFFCALVVEAGWFVLHKSICAKNKMVSKWNQPADWQLFLWCLWNLMNHLVGSQDFDPLPRMAAIYGMAELCGVGHRKVGPWAALGTWDFRG